MIKLYTIKAPTPHLIACSSRSYYPSFHEKIISHFTIPLREDTHKNKILQSNPLNHSERKKSSEQNTNEKNPNKICPTEVGGEVARTLMVRTLKKHVCFYVCLP